MLRVLRKLGLSRRASVAVEMALVGPPFTLCLVFMLELGYDLYAQEMLDYGMQTAARQIQLGNAKNITSNAVFQSTYFCPAIAGLLDCNSVTINVTVVASGTSTNDYYQFYGTSLKIAPGGVYNPAKFGFCPGQPNDLMLATAIYTSPNIVGIFVPTMPTLGGQHLTVTTVAFVNENYTAGAVPSGCPT